jgi:hypothetical protein
MRFGSSQHLKMAALVDSEAEVETDPIRKKRLQGLAVAFRIVAAHAVKREALRPTTTAATQA